LAFESNSGKTKYLIGIDADDPEKFYFEKLSAEMLSHLRSVIQTTHTLSTVHDDLNKSVELQALVASIKKLLG
jgi:hypothetical protein